MKLLFAKILFASVWAVVFSQEGIDGYDFAVLYSDDMDTPATKRDLIAHADHPSTDDRALSLHLDSGERLRMSLRKRSVVDPDTLVVELNGDREEARRLGERDCYFSGPTEGTDGHATLSMCGGRLIGNVQTNKRHYEVRSLPESSSNRRSTDSLRVLVTWTDVDHEEDVTEAITDDEYEDEHGDETPENQGAQTDSKEAREMDGLWDEVIEMPESEDDKEEHEDSQKRRYGVSRSVQDRKVVVEVANYLDMHYLNKVETGLGLTTNDELIDLQVLKWNGVQAILSDAALIGWDIKIKLVKIVIWRTHPSWYTTNSNNTIGGRLYKICTGTKDTETVDQVTLSTGDTSDPGYVGLSYIKGVCKSGYRCSAVISAKMGFFTELHEFGHSLGLNHDSKPGMNCPNGTHGFMGGNRFFFRADCYKEHFAVDFPQKDCLFVEASTSSTPTKPLLPGQTVGVEGQCPYQYGQGYEYLQTGNGDTMCSKFVCVLTDKNNQLYGSVKVNEALDGTPCGAGKICGSSACESLSSSQITIDQNQVRPLLTDGGWGSFGAWSSCSSNCGVAVKTARRQCDSPIPRYGAYCDGDQFKAQLCLTQPPCSGESNVEGVLVSQRANKVCQSMKPYFPFVGDGTRVASAGEVDKCLVKCKQTNGKWSADTFMLPDGTPCSGTDTASDISTGISRHCVQGRCMAFGCDGNSLGLGGGSSGPC